MGDELLQQGLLEPGLREQGPALERRLRATLDSLLDPHILLVAVRDSAGEVVDFEYADANAAACAYNGRTREDLIGRRLLDLLPAHVSSGLFEMYKNVIDSGEALVLDDYRYQPELRADLGERRFDIRAVPVDDGLVYTWRDVTERFAGIEALKTAEYRYRALAEAASDVVYRTDADGFIRWVAPSLQRILGWRPAEFLGHSLMDFVSSEDAQLLHDLREQAYDLSREWTPADLPLLVHVRGADGSVHPMSVFVSRDIDQATGEIAGLIVGMRDVGDLLRSREDAARASQQAEDHLLALDRAMIGMATVDDRGAVQYANQALEQMLAAPPSHLEGRLLGEWVHPEDVVMRLNRGHPFVPGEVSGTKQRRRFLATSGLSVWADVWVSPLQTAAGSVSRWLVQAVDVSAEIQANDALQRSVRRFRLLAENASDVVYQTDINGVIDWISPSVSQVLGWDPDLLIGTPAAALVAPEDLAMMTSDGAGVIRGVREHGVLAQFLTVRGSRKWMSVNAHPILGRDDDVAGAVVGLRDVTSEQEAYEELALTQQRFRLAMDAAPQGMALTDGAGVVVDINPAAAQLLGLTATKVVGQDFADVLMSQLGHCESVDRHEHIRQTEGGQIWVDHVTSSLCDDDGDVIYVIHQFVDETSDRMWQQELEHWASHDVLTGVANRRSLIDHLTRLLRAVEGAARNETVAVLFCDVDNLKALNDTYGHSVGDAVLTIIADRLARSLRRGDRVGRIGGDEFVVVLDGVEAGDELARVAEKLRLAISEPMAVMDHLVTATISIGATFASGDADAALAVADAALYRAKAEGRNRVVIAE